MNYIVVTSINQITEAIKRYSKFQDWKVILVADKKSIYYEYPNVEFLTIENQAKLGFETFSTTPYNHYSRKNIGYLYAISNNSDHIFDTDDDTIPYDEWKCKSFRCDTVIFGDRYINSFYYYTDEKVWPRGFDLSYINKNYNYSEKFQDSKIGVWQGIIDDDSDFDAIYRLTINKHIKFKKEKDICIDNNCYSPFNTQSTLWNKDIYPLLYIPISVDFRFTDILRGYIAQRIMWDYGYKLGFHSPNTYQIRNEHDYYKDFIGELNMYKQVPSVINILECIQLQNKSMQEDLIHVYESLLNSNIVKKIELENVINWIDDLNKINKNG